MAKSENYAYFQEKKTGLIVDQAHPGRRWLARLIDTAVILGGTVGSAFLVGEGNPTSNDAITSAIVFYSLATIVLGALYGRGFSPGQLISWVKSRRTRDGRVVGAFRGMCRYLGIAFFPVCILALFDSPGSAPTGWEDSVKVTYRKGRPRHEGGTPHPIP